MISRFLYFDNGGVGIGKEELPPLQDDQILVETTRTLISVGTEMYSLKGGGKARLGYSNVGRIIEAGAAVSDLQVGDRVVTLAAHADYYTHRTQACYKIPDGVSDEAASFTVLGAVALHIVERAKIALGRPVIVVGQGTVGQLVQQLARLAGAGWVIAVDLDTERRSLACELGADAAIPPSNDALEEALEQTTPGTIAPAFIDVSGSTKAIEWIFEVARLRSRIVISGSYHGAVTMEPMSVVTRELDIVGTHQPKCPDIPGLFYPYSKLFNYNYILDQINRNRIHVGKLCDGLLLPEDTIAFYEALRKGERSLWQPIIRWAE